MMTIRKPRPEAGAAVVEATLTLALFLAIVFSLVDAGYIMFLHQTLASRAEIAARYGALNPTDTTGMTNMILYNSVTGSGTGMFGLTSSNVTANRSGSGTSADRVTITIANYHYPAISLLMSGNGQPITVSIPVENN